VQKGIDRMPVSLAVIDDKCQYCFHAILPQHCSKLLSQGESRSVSDQVALPARALSVSLPAPVAAP
jgi:hypothetical protein